MMIKNIKLFCVAFCVLALCSCDKYLDIQPVGRVIPRTAKEFREMLTQAYSVVPENRGLATFSSDEMVMDASLATEDLNSFKDIWNWNVVSPSGTTASFGWRQYYQALFIANYTIEFEDKIEEGTPQEINQLVGESYMIRAYMHFLLVNVYGEAYTHCDPAISKAIPLKLNSDTETILSRNTVGEVYSSILSDLVKAEEYLNVDQWDLGYNYRFTTLTVNALRSRVYLYMGEWTKSLEASEAVLRVKSQLADLSTILPNEYNSTENILALEKVMIASYIRAAKVSASLWKLYGTGDLRKSKYFKQVTASNILVQKGGSNQFSCSFRVGEMLLNASEAALMAAGQDTEIDAARIKLLTLMKQRYTANAYAAKEIAVNAMNRDELLQEIYNERTRELAFEGHRWFDLRRTTQPRLEKTFGETYVLEEKDPRYTIRIPSEAIEANPGLAN